MKESSIAYGVTDTAESYWRSLHYEEVEKGFMPVYCIAYSYIHRLDNKLKILYCLRVNITKNPKAIQL